MSEYWLNIELRMYKCGCGVRRFLGLSGRLQAVAPKNSKSEVLLGEAKRRELETLRRQRRFELWEGFHDASIDENKSIQYFFN